jgi:hypothetical protein
MNSPAPPARKSRRGLWIGLGVASVLTIAAAVAFFVFIAGAIQRAAIGPWSVLHEVAVAAQSPATAEAFYQHHPRLAVRFPTAEAFVSATRPWAPRLAELPPQMPGMMELIKTGRSVHISTSGSTTTLTVGARTGSVTAVLVDGELVDLSAQ